MRSGQGSGPGGSHPKAGSRPVVVDCHTHTLPRHWLDLAERYGDDRWPVRQQVDDCTADLFVSGRHFRTVPHTCWDAGARLEYLDANGIGRQWLSVTPVMFSYWAPPRQCAEMARHVNESIAELAGHAPDRFTGLATLPMGDPDLAIAELDRAVTDLGLAGVEIGTNIAGRELDDPMLRPVFEAIASLNVPVFIHPWDVRGAGRLSAYNAMYTIGMPTETAYAALALLMGGVISAVPGLRVLLAHGAGALAWLLPRIDRGWATWPHLRGGAPAAPSALTGQLWADSLAGDRANVELAANRLGWDHVVLGSDYPFPFGDQNAADSVRACGFGADAESAILSANSLALLHGPAPANRGDE
ncbi:MAG TPA: amidohydrolase family protein [Streptosporangiaceae bacterium]|nr:amidohydrolase family protein [Streptosporangiaceae bacterium]